MRVTAATLECNTPAQNVFTVIIMTVWQNRQTWHYFITAVCNANCMLYTFNIAGIHNIFGHTVKVNTVETAVILTSLVHLH